MYANKFAEGYATMRLEEGHRKVSRTPSPRDVGGACSCAHSSPHAAAPADGVDCLASRISFYMDDAVISDVSPALSRQPSSRQRGAPAPNALAPPVPQPSHARRSRSFRLDARDDAPRPRLYRHGSDTGPAGARRSSSRAKRSESGRRAAGSAGGSGGTTPERGGSVRSSHHHHHHHHRSGSARRKTSCASRVSVAAPPPARPGPFPLPHADLPPKERRRRLVVLIVVVTFMFLVVCSILTVVVTLTHSSFQKSPPDGVHFEQQATTEIVRKENEELMSAITRGVMYNSSAAGSPPLEVSSTPDP